MNKSKSIELLQKAKNKDGTDCQLNEDSVNFKCWQDNCLKRLVDEYHKSSSQTVDLYIVEQLQLKQDPDYINLTTKEITEHENKCGINNSESEKIKCVKCGKIFMPRLFKPLTICDKCADSLSLELSTRNK